NRDDRVVSPINTQPETACTSASVEPVKSTAVFIRRASNTSHLTMGEEEASEGGTMGFQGGVDLRGNSEGRNHTIIDTPVEEHNRETSLI
ncbi:hypothetical protein J437_LFUL009492, partial [Ladona fulva]